VAAPDETLAYLGCRQARDAGTAGDDCYRSGQLQLDDANAAKCLGSTDFGRDC
jgi:hypothetical protein